MARITPAFRLRARRWLARMVLMVMIGVAWSVHEPVWAGFRSHRYFTVQHLAVRSDGELLDRREILDWLDLRGATNIWDMSPNRVRARLRAHPLVRQASVRREFPNRFEIEVREHRAAAIVWLDDFYYVSGDAQILMPVGAADDPDYTVITGLDAKAPPGYRIWALRRALRLVHLCARLACFGGVSEIHIDEPSGVVVYAQHPLVEVAIGWGSWRLKIERAERVIEAWGPRAAHLARIDTRYRNQVVVRQRRAAARLGGVDA